MASAVRTEKCFLPLKFLKIKGCFDIKQVLLQNRINLKEIRQNHNSVIAERWILM